MHYLYISMLLIKLSVKGSVPPGDIQNNYMRTDGK